MMSEVLTSIIIIGVGPLIRIRVYQYLSNGKLGSTPSFLDSACHFLFVNFLIEVLAGHELLRSIRCRVNVSSQTGRPHCI